MNDLKSTDLRIGNLAQIKNGDIRTVINLDNCIKVTGSSEHHTHGISGIPLTEEWLIKLGFKNNMWGDLKTDEFTKDNIAMCKVGGNHSIHQLKLEGRMCQVLITTVHQLQNLYHALTGQELQLTQ